MMSRTLRRQDREELKAAKRRYGALDNSERRRQEDKKRYTVM